MQKGRKKVVGVSRKEGGTGKAAGECKSKEEGSYSIQKGSCQTWYSE